MYEAVEDPYCYPGTSVLINKLGIRTAEALEAFEGEISSERAAEPLPPGRLSVSHFRAIHRHLFQDVYRWAGRFRTVRMSKGGNMFCYPENIESSLSQLFGQLKALHFFRGMEPEDFAVHAAHFLAELNAIHAFREGNGRTQLAFMSVLAAQADYPLDFGRLDPAIFLTAMIASFHGQEDFLAEQIRKMIVAG